MSDGRATTEHSDDFNAATELDREWLDELATSPHDAFCKRLLSNLKTAVAFFQSHLPAAVATSIDWNTLTLEHASFVRQELTQSHSDLLFSAVSHGRRVLLFLLFEHQSTVDDEMRLRLFSYLLQIWQRHRVTQPKGPLPVVIPFVLHQGPEVWTVSTQFEDQFRPTQEDGHPGSLSELGALLDYLPKFEHALLDLSQYDPQSAEPNSTLRMSLTLMRQARLKDDLLEYFALLNQHFANVASEFFRFLLLYALHVDKTLDVEVLLGEYLTSPTLKGTTMSTAELLIAKGEAKGELKGEVKGITKGHLLGSIQMLEMFLKIPGTPLAVLKSMSLDDLEETRARLQSQFDDAGRR